MMRSQDKGHRAIEEKRALVGGGGAPEMIVDKRENPLGASRRTEGGRAPRKGDKSGERWSGGQKEEK